jgi:hypothetical protein
MASTMKRTPIPLAGSAVKALASRRTPPNLQDKPSKARDTTAKSHKSSSEKQSTPVKSQSSQETKPHINSSPVSKERVSNVSDSDSSDSASESDSDSDSEPGEEVKSTEIEQGISRQQ